MDRDLADTLWLCDRATPGPWFQVNADDTHFMNLIGVATERSVDGTRAFSDGYDSAKMIAATLVQEPRYVSCEDDRWDENAMFIAAARELVPKLVEEVAALRQQLRDLEGDGAVDGASGE